ncbi:MAG: DUF1800 domain-containing protein [Flavobacteriales bacterium]|nr:DUF1800 domain-containing protein [Flavobacteriales bacterium]
MAITLYTGPFGRPELQHLLRRSIFGATTADLAHFEGMSLDQVIDELLTFTNDTLPPVKAYADANSDPNGLDPNVAFGDTWVNTPRNPPDDTDVIQARLESWAAWWAGQLVGQQRNLREKLTLFWQNHMPAQVGVVFHSEAMYQMNQLLRTQCGGNFRQLIHDVTLEPAMLYYLNGYLNVAGAPDENYGRELLELFTLGQGSGYTEEDVQAAARVLTGWTVLEESGGIPILPQPIFFPFNHTPADKTFSAFFNNTVIAGGSGPNAGENELNAMLDMILANEQCSRFMCRELYRFFVHGEIQADTEAEVIEPLAELFRDNVAAPDQIRVVLRALLTSEHFFNDQVRGCMIMNPVDLVVGNLRMLGMPFPDPSLFEALHITRTQVYWLIDYAGQNIADPPNVAGWPAYYLYPSYDNLWLDTATYPSRNNSQLGIIYGTFDTPSNTVLPDNANLVFSVDLVAFTQQLQTPTDPNALIDQLAELFFVNPISQGVKNQLKQNYLLLGQLNDDYWSVAYATYVADPNTTDMTAQLVPDILHWLVGDMQQAAERQLF